MRYCRTRLSKIHGWSYHAQKVVYAFKVIVGRLHFTCGAPVEISTEERALLFHPWMRVFWVSLWLIISLQSFNLGACSGRSKPWKQLALSSPTVRVSFAVDDGNIYPARREWTSQSKSSSARLNPVLLQIVHAVYTHIRNKYSTVSPPAFSLPCKHTSWPAATLMMVPPNNDTQNRIGSFR